MHAPPHEYHGRMPNVGPLELAVVLIIALVIFGPKRLPMLGRSLGQGMREFKDSITGHHKDEEDEERPALTESGATPAVEPPAAATPAATPPAATPPASERESAEVGSRDAGS